MRAVTLATALPALFLWACPGIPPSGAADSQMAEFLSGFVAASSAGGPQLARYYLPSASISGLVETPGTSAKVHTGTLPDFIVWLDTMGEPEQILHSLDFLHLFRVDGEWRISAHAWTTEQPGFPSGQPRGRPRDR